MSPIILGNLIAVLNGLILIAGGVSKSKDRVLFFQNAESITYALYCIVLGSISGFIINLSLVPRNILASRYLLTLPWKIFLLVASAGTSLIISILKFKSTGQIDWVGLLPIIATVVYTILVEDVEEHQFKLLTVLNVGIWLIHDILIKGYVTAVFDVIFMITSSISAYQIWKENRFY
ncbi:MAG: YgjV family protein [Methanobrevibacter sp.]|nr:YgjV family protein [Methanobrevibacter sp.]